MWLQHSWVLPTFTAQECQAQHRASHGLHDYKGRNLWCWVGRYKMYWTVPWPAVSFLDLNSRVEGHLPKDVNGIQMLHVPITSERSGATSFLPKATALTTEFSVFIVLTCKQSSMLLVVLLASGLSSATLLLCLALASLSPFSLSGGGLGWTSLRCFLVTWASGPCTVLTCFLRELGSVYLFVHPGILHT